MLKALMPFWIYWGLLVLICILFLYMPLLFFPFLPMLLVLVPAWFIVVYLIGDAVSRTGILNRITKRIGVSFLCSFFTILILPVGLWIEESIEWDKFYLDSLLNSFRDKSLWIIFAIHFFTFWIGEEMGNLAAKADEDKNNE